MNTMFFGHNQRMTSWDIRPSTFVQSANLSDFSTGISFNNDGTRIYLSTPAYGSNTPVIRQLTLTTAWDVSTMDFYSLSVSPSIGHYVYNMHIARNGIDVISVGYLCSFKHLQMSTPWDITTLTEVVAHRYVETSQVILDQGAFGLDISDDGRRLFYRTSLVGDIRSYTMSTPYDTSTMTFDNKTLYAVNGKAFQWVDRGKYIIFMSNDVLNQFSYGTRYDVSGRDYWETYAYTPTDVTGINSVYFRPDGKKYYFVSSDQYFVYEYDM